MANRRHHYLQALYAEGPPKFTREYLGPIISNAAKAANDTSPPSSITVYRWHRRYQRAKDARALIPRYDRRGARHSKQSDIVLNLVAEAVTDAFRASPLATGADIHSRVITKINRENQSRIGSERLKVPALRTTYRLLGRASSYELCALREGKAAADRRFRIIKAGVQTTRILERVEVDHTPLDLFLLDDETWLPHGRPILTMAIDHFSRMPLGYYLSFGAPSAAAVVGALRHAVLHKTPAQSIPALVHAENKWLCYGIPEALIVDNGLEFLGATLESIAMDLRIRIEFCPARQPRFKGVVERFLKTINYHFAHQLPGTSFARFYQRGDYDPEKHALLTLAEFNQIFEKWILDVYAQRIHRGIGTTPMQKWKEGIKLHEPELPANRDLLLRRIGQITERKLRADGIELKGFRYNGDELSSILRAYGAGVSVRVAYDPEDLGEIQVWGPDDEDPVSVRALNYELAKGLTVRQNALIRELAREANKGICNEAAVQRAREELVEAVEKLANSRAQKSRQRSGAIRGLSSTKPEAKLNKGSDAKPSRRRPDKEGMDVEVKFPQILLPFKMGKEPKK
jgi:putative transposase